MELRIIIIALIGLSSAQLGIGQNLVPNPSFEEYSNTFCGIMGAGQFEQTINDWISPTDATPIAYFTNIEPTCYNYQPLSLYDGPIGIKGSQFPRTGGVMAGIWLYTIPGFDKRQYLQVGLDSPMEIGSSYVVEFHVSLADSIESYIDRIGAYLSTGPITGSGDGPLGYSPQFNADGFVSEATEWVSISDTFVAEEAYTYLTIGNFFNDLATTTLPNPIASGAVSTYGAFYFVDDVRIVELTPVGLDSSENFDLQVNPSLVTDQMELIITQDHLPCQVQVITKSGQVVMERQVGYERTRFDLSMLPAGVYIFHVATENKVHSKRIIKTDG